MPRRPNRWTPTRTISQSFAHELILARDAGLLTFEDANGYMMPVPDPVSDAHLWLQRIRDIRLTFAGHNWARGRVVLQPWPDPGEDDGRLVTGLTLQEIAREISRTFLPHQLRQFLQESAIPEEFLDTEEGLALGSEYVLAVLVRLLNEGSAGRRAFRTFVGRWLSGELHAGPEINAGRRIRALLAKQGWHLRDGRLMVGEVVPLDEGTADDHARQLLALHPEVRVAASSLLSEHQGGAAVYEAFAAVVGRIRKLTGITSAPGAMIAEALGGDEPRIRLSNLATPEGKVKQAALWQIFVGAAAGLSDPDRRTWLGPVGESDVLERLGFASMLMRLLDEAGIQPRG